MMSRKLNRYAIPIIKLTGITNCNLQIHVEDVWVQGFPKLITESAFRMLDVNKDGTLDVIIGFGTG